MNKKIKKKQNIIIVGWLGGFYGISTFVGYLTPNPFFVKVLIQLIQFRISSDFIYKQLNVRTVLY